MTMDDKLILITCTKLPFEEDEKKFLEILDFTIPISERHNYANIELEEVELIIPFVSANYREHLIKLLKLHDILKSTRDITMDILTGKELDKDITDLFKVPEFNSLREEFILRYRTMDMVLDKISFCGIESLTEADKKILADY